MAVHNLEDSANQMSRALKMTLMCIDRVHDVVYAERDLRLLHSPQVPEGARFIAALGVFDNFTVAHGQDTEAWTSRALDAAFDAAGGLLKRVREDEGLLPFDYEYRMPGEKSWRRSGPSGVPIGDRYGKVRAGPGLLAIEVREMSDGALGSLVETIDLRALDHYQVTEYASIRVRRIPHPHAWSELLPALLEFLKQCHGPEVRIRHHYAR